MQNQKALAALYHQQTSKHGQTSQNQSQMNLQTDVNLTKKKRIVFWAYLFAILCFCIAMTILAAKSWVATSDFVKTDAYYLSFQVAQDWQKGFISDMKVVNGNTTNCPAGYENAINYNWPGSSFGCYCAPSVNLSFVLEGYCSPGLIQDGCLNLKNQAQFTVNNWNNYSRICLKRSPVSFFNQQRYNGVNKLCGSSQSLVVVPQSQACPYVNVSFTLFALQDHYTTVSDPDIVLNTLYASFNSTSPYSFYSYPITKFDVQEYQFCQMDQDLGISPSHSDYILLNVERGCASIGNYSQLDVQTEIIFFQNNPLLQDLTNIQGFPTPGNYQYLFGFQSLTGWTYQCRHNFNKKYSIPKAVDQFSYVYRTQYQNFLIGVTICLVIQLLEIVILGLRRMINSAIYPIGYKQRYLLKHFVYAILRYIVDVTAKFGLFGLALTNIFTIYTNYNWFKGAINQQCSDGNFGTRYAILNPFLTLYTSLFSYAITIIIVCLAMIIIDIIHFAYIWKNELTHYLVQSNDKQMVKKEDPADYQYLEQKDAFEFKDLKDEDLVPKEENDQFRITMAQNIFAREESIEPAAGKLKKKKKKRASPIKKKEEDGDEVQRIVDNDEFNPYALDDLESPTFTEPKGPSSSLKKRKR